jgi:DNA-binding MarR family transcriptional regulator
VSPRDDLEHVIVADVRALSLESDRIGRVFAARNNLGGNDFRALVDIMVAHDAGTPLTAGELRDRLGLSGAAITYLVERMIASGHLIRETDPADRRKVILRYADHGMAVARSFFTPLAEHHRRALADLPDEDLAAAHRVLEKIIGAMQAFAGDLSG